MSRPLIYSHLTQDVYRQKWVSIQRRCLQVRKERQRKDGFGLWAVCLKEAGEIDT